MNSVVQHKKEILLGAATAGVVVGLGLLVKKFFFGKKEATEKPAAGGSVAATELQKASTAAAEAVEDALTPRGAKNDSDAGSFRKPLVVGSLMSPLVLIAELIDNPEEFEYVEEFMGIALGRVPQGNGLAIGQKLMEEARNKGRLDVEYAVGVVTAMYKTADVQPVEETVNEVVGYVRKLQHCDSPIPAALMPAWCAQLLQVASALAYQNEIFVDAIRVFLEAHVVLMRYSESVAPANEPIPADLVPCEAVGNYMQHVFQAVMLLGGAGAKEAAVAATIIRSFSKLIIRMPEPTTKDMAEHTEMMVAATRKLVTTTRSHGTLSLLSSLLEMKAIVSLKNGEEADDEKKAAMSEIHKESTDLQEEAQKLFEEFEDSDEENKEE